MATSIKAAAADSPSTELSVELTSLVPLTLASPVGSTAPPSRSWSLAVTFYSGDVYGVRLAPCLQR